ncbi:unnamed protein product [Mytilus coruscus]|uniref:Kazal-like domain-containing protein n=1 Tax=Mytilus coruscus TaxID=42192 RepID=A0A6J8C648_MYTCO|nr:unnamed protein product [Mytilus coruscus]
MYVDCKTEALPGNKLYRDNNGKIYDNFCTYSQAKCRDSSIDLESICTCVHPMIHTPVTPDLQTTSSTLTPTQEFITTLAAANFSTQPKVSPTVKPTMAPPTQNVTTQDALISSFCENKDNITCSKDPDHMCGSDNTTYKNSCTYSQAKCRDSSIDLESICTCVNPMIHTPVTPDLQTTSSTLTPTQEFITTLAAANFSTQPKVSPTVKPTMAPPTQNVTTQDALISSFCENKDNITCSKDPDHMCGSDNTTYKNR